MEFKKKLFSSLAAGAMLLYTVTPVAAGITLEVSGNGSDSDSEIKYEQENEVEVTQVNEAEVLNDVEVKVDTGDNEAEDNTNGDVKIKTGDAETNVTVSNTLNSNVAEVETCCTGDVEAKISGNGTDSDNEIKLELENETEVEQYNAATVLNYVEAKSDTGDNEAEDNTGGEVEIKTGDAVTNVSVSTAANTNSAWVMGEGDGGSLSAMISDNGSDTDNEMKLELEDETELLQTNAAEILNDVEVKSDTGDNEAEDNTGGKTEIETGDAMADVSVDNMANFNSADIDGCGCLEDVLAKIHGNGTDSDNEIKAELESEKEVEQYNDLDCKGEIKDACAEVEVKLDTGDNEAEDNTLGGDDPAIETGSAEADVDVSNSGNSNVYGSSSESEWEMPWGFDFNFNFSFDLDDLMDALMS
jgi:hypothetical protein